MVNEPRPATHGEFREGTWAFDHDGSLVTFDGHFVMHVITDTYPNLVDHTYHRNMPLTFFLPLAEIWAAIVATGPPEGPQDGPPDGPPEEPPTHSPNP